MTINSNTSPPLRKFKPELIAVRVINYFGLVMKMIKELLFISIHSHSKHSRAISPTGN